MTKMDKIVSNVITEIFVRNPYNYDTNKASNDSSLKCEDKSLTIQSEKADADINTIVKRFGLTGHLPSNIRIPRYGDFTGVDDYQSALNAVKAADETFNSLPAEVRRRFDNDPEQFVEFCLDEKNRKELFDMGLTEKAPEVEIKAQPVENTGEPST